MRRRAVAVVLLWLIGEVVSACFVADSAYARSPRCGIAVCKTTGGGVSVAITQRDLDRLRRPAVNLSRSGPAWEGTVTPACPGNDPAVGGPYDVSCAYMTNVCRMRGEGDGPMAWIWRRPLAPSGDPSGSWVQVGYSCNERLPRNVLSLGDVRRAFRQVGFARPRLLSQPHGGWALVNLDTYYAVAWPDVGVGPGQVVTVELLGHRVGIRPKVVTYGYDFGDGDRVRTADPGGPYPVGKVRHAYRRTGEVRVGVTARYSADFSVDGGAFRGLDDTVDIAGPSRTLRVYQARARLIPSVGEE